MLWDGIDDFPDYWDMSSIYRVLSEAYRDPGKLSDAVNTTTGYNEIWERVFAVTRRAACGPRLIQ